jgi:hypothetical protein
MGKLFVEWLGKLEKKECLQNSLAADAQQRQDKPKSQNAQKENLGKNVNR